MFLGKVQLSRLNFPIIAAVLGCLFFLLVFQHPIKRHILYQRNFTKQKAKMVILNHDLPSFERLAGFAKVPSQKSAGVLADFTGYYEQIIRFFPKMGDAYSILGFCHFYLGDIPKAESLYQQSVSLAPKLFWPYYSLGVIYLKQQKDDLALQYLSKAVRLQPQEISQALAMSKVYQQILTSKGIGVSLGEILKSSYSQAYWLMGMVAFQNKDFSQAESFAAAAVKMHLDDDGKFLFLAAAASYMADDHKKADAYIKGCLKKNSSYPRAQEFSQRINEYAAGSRISSLKPSLTDLLPALDRDSIQLRIF